MKVIHWRYAGDWEWIGAVDGVDVATARKTGSDLVPWGWTVHEPPALGAVDAAGVADTADAAMAAIAETIGATDGMYARFPYSPGHNPAYCDHCSDNGFVETPRWRRAWDLAARAYTEDRRLAAAKRPEKRPIDPSTPRPTRSTRGSRPFDMRTSSDADPTRPRREDRTARRRPFPELPTGC